MTIVIPLNSRHAVVYNVFIMKTEPNTEVFLQNLLKPTDRKNFETVTTLLKTFCSQEQKVPIGNICSRDLSFLGTFVPWTFRSQQQLLMRPFILRLLYVFVVLLLIFRK